MITKEEEELKELNDLSFPNAQEGDLITFKNVLYIYKEKSWVVKED